jgi:type IV secretory pathway TraG/TraD family ATPase VirD4
MSDRLGTAEWEAPAAVSKRYPFGEGKIWLGRSQDGSPIGYCDDRHVCLCSGTRAGKGSSVIVNNLCFWPGSAVVVDPKGESCTVSAARRGQGNKYCAGLGQAVHVLDPFHAAEVDDCYRSSFNPFDALDPDSDETIDEASRLADAIVIVKDEAHDPFWDESARKMLRGLILHVLTWTDYLPEERNLITLRKLITCGDWQMVEAIRADGHAEEEIGPPHLLLWRQMEANEAFRGVIAATGLRFRTMMSGSAKQFEGVLQAVDLHTEFLDSPGMQRCLATSDFKLSELKTRPEGMTLYLSLPQRYMNTHHRWLRMMVVLTTTQMEITRGNPATGHPVLVILDEFAGLRRMEAIEKSVAQIAGFGVKLFFVLQTLEQLKGTYKDHWETFLANAGLKIFFSIEDHFTRDYVSKLVGETEIIREMQSVNESQAQSQSRSDGSSRTETASESKTEGKSSTHTDSTSQATNTSRTEGANQSSSINEGNVFTVGWFGWKNYLSNNASYGRTEGFSTSTSHGSTNGRGSSDARGKSSSDTSGSSRATGTSQTTTEGRTLTTGAGRSETVHRRPLIQPDEVGRLFTRCDDKNDPLYPGLALVMVTGGNPLVVRRTNYFEDLEFIDCFSPHPDHKFLAPASYTVGGIRPLINQFEAVSRKRLTIAKWFIKTGEIGQVERPNQAAAVIEHIPPDNRTISIHIPYSGKVTQTAAVPENLLPSGNYAIPESPLFTIKNYPDATQEFSGIDPFAELREALKALPQSKHAARKSEEALSQSAKVAEHTGWAQVFGLALVTLALELIAFRIASDLISPWENFGFLVVLLGIFVTGNILITRSCPKNRQGLLVIIRLLTFGGAFAAFTVHLAVHPSPPIPTYTYKHTRQPKS